MVIVLCFLVRISLTLCCFTIIRNGMMASRFDLFSLTPENTAKYVEYFEIAVFGIDQILFSITICKTMVWDQADLLNEAIDERPELSGVFQESSAFIAKHRRFVLLAFAKSSIISLGASSFAAYLTHL
ncbi:unnamed protein product [Caenorhabditis auriculariae]|uniref:Uncharacterized protein n=1 Tax=Caenorhabditis auriculariae TaxID=2777116 RepID=A0A8S1HR20_9PELO|nr:unnamed protein product [Caenorhabditis auriculariae]